MTDAYRQLEIRFTRLFRLEHAVTFLHWDHQVMMPPGGQDGRAKALAELAVLQHELLTAPELGSLIRQARDQDLSPDRQRSLDEMEREWRLAVCLPAPLVKARILAASKCEHGWRRQRPANDWSGFLANFREVVQLAREEARIRQATAPENFPTAYDALLDLSCRGDSAELITGIFARLKDALPPLLEQVARQQRPAELKGGRYPVDCQYRLNRELMSCLGFDFRQGRLDESGHPFSTGTRGDHRITTRFRPDDFIEALKATAHETGHAAYEGGLPPQWEGLPVGGALNLSLHESQSLLFENQIFLSQAFTRFFTAKLHTHLPATAGFDTALIWRALTRVVPGRLRVEADEVSYPLHVLLRFEIERDLINGALEPDDIPEAWDHKMVRYLGIDTTGDFTDGCLQDIHWAEGAFGYFPAYALGALNSAQLFAAIRRIWPDWQDRLGSGDIRFVREWLGREIWEKGRSLSSQDLLRSATGEGTNPDHFLEYITDRYLLERS